jgi:hypothetical protein
MYVLSYFRTEAEALHLAISDDGWHWKALSNNRPILDGSVKTKTLRDPFIMQAQDGQFHLFASDGWQSLYIVHASSEDLLHWSDQEALPAMKEIEGARNAWAPECFYDYEQQLYRIIWSSTVSVNGPPQLRDHRIWSMATRDFKTYTPAQMFLDPGYNVIDATVGHHADKYLIAFKDERGDHSQGTDFKAIRVCLSDKGIGPFGEISGLISPCLVEGPTLFRAKDQWVMLYDHFMGHHYGASVSADGLQWRIVTKEMTFPPEPRHGSVLEIPETLGARLRKLMG